MLKVKKYLLMHHPVLNCANILLNIWATKRRVVDLTSSIVADSGQILGGPGG